MLKLVDIESVLSGWMSKQQYTTFLRISNCYPARHVLQVPLYVVCPRTMHFGPMAKGMLLATIIADGAAAGINH